MDKIPATGRFCSISPAQAFCSRLPNVIRVNDFQCLYSVLVLENIDLINEPAYRALTWNVCIVKNDEFYLIFVNLRIDFQFNIK
jgi:hypothetical protein